MQTFKFVIQSIKHQINCFRGMIIMSFYWRLRHMLRKTKEIERLERDLEKEKGVIRSKGVRGVRDALREIDDKTSKNESRD